nr:septation protein SepH [[Pseudopropionibacterium] massiliense]
MDSALSPREIQSRIRGGATLAEVATEAGVDPARIEGFALPVLAEREHMTNTALECAVRRRGDGSGHRRLQELISTRLQARGIDSGGITWDSWREPDRKWRLVGVLESHERRAEFIFDPRGRFTIADNPDARWMIGEEIPGSKDPDNENTVDFDDEFALVRATTQPTTPPALPGDDVPTDSFDEGPATSELDDLYDMLSGVSEDSVRIYVGLDDESAEDVARERGEHTPDEDFEETEVIDDFAGIPEVDITETVETSLIGSPQDSLIDTEDTAPQPKSRHRRRARVPSWDEIMFGGPPHRTLPG